eukprot:TRINITY_DN3312_c0_g1_i2.p1 TRINITY_DN3312_c0_g1~~TRINITY_DN3312_c0_g1_i2.p1  ORF type:complete len:124 (+),score=24.26 TRINITY_DN3312_c0_g1_i2:545-916(+)
MVGKDGVVIRVETTPEGVEQIIQNISKGNPELLERILILQVPDYAHCVMSSIPLQIDELEGSSNLFDVIYAEHAKGKLSEDLEKSLKLGGKLLIFNDKSGLTLKQRHQLDQAAEQLEVINRTQ